MGIEVNGGVFASGVNDDYIRELCVSRGAHYDASLNELVRSIRGDIERAVLDTLRHAFLGREFDLDRALAGSDLAWQTRRDAVAGACCIWQHADFRGTAGAILSGQEPSAWRRLSPAQRFDAVTRLATRLEEAAADTMRDNATMDGWETMREVVDETFSREDVQSVISSVRSVDPHASATAALHSPDASAEAPLYHLICEDGTCLDLPSLDALMGACSWLGWEDGPDGTSIYGYQSALAACEDMNVELSNGPSDPGRYDEAVYCAHAMSYDTLVGVCGRTHEEAVEFMGIAPDQIELVNDSIRTHNVSRETPIPLAPVGTDHAVPRHR